MKKGYILSKLVEIQKLLWKDDDFMEQETLFEVQDKLAKLVADLANDLNKEKEIADLFPWLYSFENDK